MRDGTRRLVGRATELDLLAAAVRRAVDGGCELVAIEGSAGVGKTALTKALIELWPDDGIVLRTAGVPAEEQIDFAVVDQLVREAMALGLPAPDVMVRSAARPALAEVGALLLDLAERYSVDRPLLVVIDDAHWVDVASLQALVFAQRRLFRGPTLLAVAHRPVVQRLEPLHRLIRDGGGLHLELVSLSPAAVADLIRVRFGLRLSRRAAHRLHHHSGGNPLETILLAEELDAEELLTGLGDLPAPRSYASLILSRLAASSDGVIELATLVAAAGGPLDASCLSGVLDADELAQAWESATASGLLRQTRHGGHDGLDVGHPLTRTAIYADLNPLRRAQLHRRLADLVTDEDQALRHRLRSGTDDDADLVDAATARAEDHLANGWVLSAVDFLRLGAGRAAEGTQRYEIELRAADLLLSAGDPATAQRLLEAIPAGGHPMDSLVRGRALFYAGQSRAAADPLGDASSSADRWVAARAKSLLALIAVHGIDASPAVLAREALSIAAELPPANPVSYALSSLVTALTLDGDLPGAAAEVDLWEQRIGPTIRQELSYNRGTLALWSGALSEAERHLVAALDFPSDVLLSASAAYGLIDTLYRQGRWDDAEETLTRAWELVDETGAPLATPMVYAVASFVASGRGDLATARARIAAAAAQLARMDRVAAYLWLAVARGRLAIAAGDSQSVVAALSPLADVLAESPLPEGMLPWRADLVEALVQSGELDRAEQILAQLDAQAPSGVHAAAGAVRARAALLIGRGRTAEAAAAFDTALADATLEQAGEYEVARLEVASADLERRAGRRRRAAELLDRAIERCTVLGSEPLLHRATTERATCGLDPSRSAWARDLTAAEENVARLVAGGMSNRAAAESLFISVRTVETHLGRVFAKLGLRSRTELSLRLRDELEDT